MSECAGFNVPIDIIIGHFGDVYFQSITCTDADNLTRIITNKRENTKNNTYDQSILANIVKETIKKPVTSRPWADGGPHAPHPTTYILWYFHLPLGLWT